MGLITPFNFPMAIPTWKMFPALVCGNAVIIKPSEDVPHTVHILVEILLEAGLRAAGHSTGLLGPRIGSVTYRVLSLSRAPVLALPPAPPARS